MTKAECIALVKVLMGAYPNNRVTDPRTTVESYLLVLGEYPAESVYKAARLHMATSKWFPQPEEIIKKMSNAHNLYGSDTTALPFTTKSIPGCTVCLYGKDCGFAKCIFEG